MKKTLLLLAFLMSACATTTHYEDCVENDLYKRYGSVDACVAERRDAHQRRASAAAGFGQALQNSGSSSNNSQNCTSYRDVNGYVHTKCR